MPHLDAPAVENGYIQTARRILAGKAFAATLDVRDNAAVDAFVHDVHSWHVPDATVLQGI